MTRRISHSLRLTQISKIDDYIFFLIHNASILRAVIHSGLITSISKNTINLVAWHFQRDGEYRRDFLFLPVYACITRSVHIAILRDVSTQQPRSLWTAQKRKYIVTNDSFPTTESSTYCKQMRGPGTN